MLAYQSIRAIEHFARFQSECVVKITNIIMGISTAMRICFLDRETYAPHLQLRRPAIDHQWQEHANSSHNELIHRLQNVDIIVTNKVQLRENILAKLPALQFITLTATGFDNVDIAYCRKANIGVANVRDYASTTLCEHTIGLMLALSRNLVAYHQSVIKGRWAHNRQFCYFDYPIVDLANATLCIIGRGNLGKAVGTMASTLGMHVIYAEHKHSQQTRKSYTPFYQALESADVISLHCPLNSDTQGLLSTKEFAAMHRKPLIINTARGALIDEYALCHALDSGKIRGSALDVLSQEPPSAKNPLLATPRTNLLLTPHIAWASDAGQLRAWEQAMENIENWCANINTRRVV